MSICSNCGATLPDTAKFCTICGSPVAPTVPNDISAPEVSAPEQHSVLQQVPSEAKLVSPEPSPIPQPSAEPAPAPVPTPSAEPAPEAYAQPIPTPTPQAAPTAYAQATQDEVKKPTAYEQASMPKQPQSQNGQPIFPADQHRYQNTTYQNFQPGQPAYTNGAPQPQAQPNPTAGYGVPTQQPQPNPAAGYGMPPQQAQAMGYGASMQQPNPGYPGQPYPGAPVQPYPGAPTGQKKPLSKGVIAGIIGGGIAVALIIIILVCVLVLGKKPYEKPVANLEKGMNNHDIATVLDAFPDSFASQYSTYAYLFDDIMDYDISNVSIDILSATKLTPAELDDYSNYSMFAYMDSSFNVTEGYSLYVSISGMEDGYMDTDTGTIIVGKVNGKWCIIDLE